MTMYKESALSNEKLEKVNGGYLFYPGNGTIEVINDKNRNVIEFFPGEWFEEAYAAAVASGNVTNIIDWTILNYLRENPKE